MTSSVPGIVHIKKNWHLEQNPFPSQGIARLGGEDERENGLLFDPGVQDDKFREAAEKFGLGAAYSGLKFGFLWSLGLGLHGDARGFGKSSLMQYLAETINEDFGEKVFLDAGLDASDAEEHPICAVLASFDMANVRSLHAVFFAAVEYACRFHRPEHPTLLERGYQRLTDRMGSSDQAQLLAAVNTTQLELRGRTLGPPVAEFLELLCSGDFQAVIEHLGNVTPARRTRNGALYLATLLIFLKNGRHRPRTALLRPTRGLCGDDNGEAEANPRDRAFPGLPARDPADGRCAECGRHDAPAGGAGHRRDVATG